MKYVLSIAVLAMLFMSQMDTPAASLLAKFYAGGQVHLIGPSIVSTSMGEYSPTFDSKRNELFFMRRTPGEFDYTIYQSNLGEGGWSKPEVVSFSGQFRDAGPYLSPDGNTLFFDSRRPAADLAKNSINLWYAQRGPQAWQAAKLLYAPSLNTSDEPQAGVDEFGPAVDGQGALFFYSFRQPYREGARYVTFPPDYAEVELVKEIPDPSWRTFVSYLYLSPDGMLAIMEGKSATGRDTDLYCACREQSGTWSGPKALTQLNTTAAEGGPFLTADGHFLFFTSDRTASSITKASANLYVVEAEAIVKFCQS
jgi:hypothetical protein